MLCQNKKGIDLAIVEKVLVIPEKILNIQIVTCRDSKPFYIFFHSQEEKYVSLRRNT